MRYDKSLKLINYAKVTDGNLQLYTELDHSFIVGDKLYIVGGYYDNCNSLMYSTGDLYNDYATGYEVLDIIDSNSFVIKYPLVDGVDPLIYPYGKNSNNKFGDPFNNTHKAYNCYTTTVEKGVYISTAAFTRGILKRGTVNNGIFGNDYHTVILNNKGAVSGTVSNTDLVINHMVGKNVEISKGQINSKTDASNLASSKIKVVEDLSAGTVYNPFSIATVSVTNNNDGYGYNYFERITNTATDVIINNGTFANPNNSFIALNNITINKAKLGNNNTFVKPLANQMDNITLNTGYVANINTLNDVFYMNGGVINTMIPITLEPGNPTPVSYSASLKIVDFQVDYDVIANHIDPTGMTVYITGITGTDNYDLSHVTGTINSVSYTFGTLTSAVISIEIDVPGVVTGGDWTAWKTANPVTDYDFTNMKIHLLQNRFEAGKFSGLTSISSFFDSSINFIAPDLVLQDSIVVEGYFRGVTLKGSNAFNGVSKGISAYITTSAQIDQDTAGPSEFIYSRIYNNLTPLYGNFTSSYIQKGIIQNSNMVDCVCIPKTLGTDVIFLYLTRISGLMYLHDEVYWDLLNSRDVTKSYIQGSTTYVQGSYLGNGRNTGWTTGPYAFNPEYKENPNRIQALMHDSGAGVIYQSQSIAKSTNSVALGLPTNLTKKFHVPSSENIQDPLTTTDIIVVYDRGTLSLTSTNWNSLLNRNDVLYAEYLSTGTLDTKINNRNNATTVPANDADFPFVDQGLAYRDLNTIDNNYIHSSVYYKSPHVREASEINLVIYEPAPLIPPYDNQFPDPTYTPSLTTEFKIQGPGMFQCADGGTVTVTDGTYNFTYLKVIGTVDNNLSTPANFVPECFIEVERVRVNYYNVGFTVLKSVELYHPNVTRNNFDRFDVTVNANDFTNYELQLPQDVLNPAPLTLQKDITNNIEIVVDYWVTWYYYDTSYSATTDGTTSGYRGSARTKRTETYRFN